MIVNSSINVIYKDTIMIRKHESNCAVYDEPILCILILPSSDARGQKYIIV